MMDNIEAILSERAYKQSIKKSRYRRVITLNKFKRKKAKGLSDLEILQAYSKQCEYTDEGIYRCHKSQMTPYQAHWKEWLMHYDYTYMLTIRLPYRNICGYKRSRHQNEAKEQYRRLIQLLEIAYTGHKHWVKDPIDFIGVMEHGKEGYWHVHLGILTYSIDLNFWVNKMQQAIDTVIRETPGLYKNVFQLSTVFDKEGMCEYFVKELQEENEDRKDEGSYLFSLYNWFHVKTSIPVPPAETTLDYVRFIVKKALYLKKTGQFYKPNPIEKLYRRKIVNLK